MTHKIAPKTARLSLYPLQSGNLELYLIYLFIFRFELVILEAAAQAGPAGAIPLYSYFVLHLFLLFVGTGTFFMLFI